METKTVQLLVVEDHRELAGNIADFFDSPEYSLDFAYNGPEALYLASSRKFDVILLDLMLPGDSGANVCRNIRAGINAQTPVIIMSARDSLDDKEQVFSLGADDYVVKPFHLRELKLRIDALIRRINGSMAAPRKIGPFTLRKDKQILSVDGQGDIQLSGTSGRILEELVNVYPETISYGDLIERIWGEKGGDIYALRTHIHTLRKQIFNQLGLHLISTSQGIGYRLVSP